MLCLLLYLLIGGIKNCAEVRQMFCFDPIFTIFGISNENEFERCYFDVPKLVTVRGILAI